VSGGQVRLPSKGWEWCRALEPGASDALQTRAIEVPTIELEWRADSFSAFKCTALAIAIKSRCC
jgi:hypothetical protein